MPPLGDITSVPSVTAPVFTGQVSTKRIDGHGGTALVSGDFALSAGWGTTPTLSITANSRDHGGSFTIVAKATTGSNPTVTLTFHDGTWTNIPAVVCDRTDVAAATATPSASVTNQFVPTTVSATQIIFTFNGQPVANNTYGCSWICMGT